MNGLDPCPGCGVYLDYGRCGNLECEYVGRYPLAEANGHAPGGARRLNCDPVGSVRTAPVRTPTNTSNGRSVGEAYTPDSPGSPDTSNTSNTPDTESLLSAVRDGAWLSRQEFPPLRYAVDGLVPEGYTLLVGAPKVGKSRMLLGLLLAVASKDGMALSSVPTGPARPVLYLALEDSDRRMQDRCRTHLAPGEDIPELFTYVTAVEPAGLDAMILAWLDAHPDAGVIVVDTLGKVMPRAWPGESAYQHDYRVGSGLKRLADARRGLSLVVVHHDRKAESDDFLTRVSGTQGLAGAADTVMVLRRARFSSQALIQVTGRDVPEGEYAAVVGKDERWALDGGSLDAAASAARQRAAEQKLGGTSNDILAAVRASGSGGVTAAEMVKEFGTTAYVYLGRLVTQGWIVKTGRGTYYDPDHADAPREVTTT